MRSQKKVLLTIVGNVTNDLYYKNVKNSRPWVLRKKVPKNHWNAPDKKSLFGTAERLVVYNFTKNEASYSVEQSSEQRFQIVTKQLNS